MKLGLEVGRDPGHIVLDGYPARPPPKKGPQPPVFGLCVCLSAATCPHYCTDPDITWGNGRGCPLVVRCWADLQSVHGFRCYDNIARTRNVSE